MTVPAEKSPPRDEWDSHQHLGSMRHELLGLVHLIGAWSIPVILADREERVSALNRGAASLYGRGEGEAMSLPWRSVVGEDESLDPQPSPGTRTRRYEAEHRTKEGKPLHVMVTRTDLVSETGAQDGSFILVTDLTASKALERKLAFRVAQLSAIREIAEALQSAMDLGGILRTILVGATAGEGLGFNRAFLLLVDEKRGELRGRVAIGPSDPDEAYRVWSDLAVSNSGLKTLLRKVEPLMEATEGRVHETVRGMRAGLADGDHFLVRALRSTSTVRVVGGAERAEGRPVDATLLERLGVQSFVAVPLTAEGKPVGLLLADNIITGRPIEDEDVEALELLGMQAALALERAHLTGKLETQIASLEQATMEIRSNQERILRSERLSAVGEMAARVAHEIRNPLVAIGGFARQLLHTTAPEDPDREAIQIIADEARRLETIVREVLDYSRPAQPRIGHVDLQKLAFEALELLKWEMDEAGVKGRVDAQAEIPPAAVDRDHLLQAMLNIVRNAIHAMPQGGTVTLHISAGPAWLEMAVEDTGIGMSPEVRSRVFEPFFTTKSAGSGLGLTIASQIIRDHRGEIQVKSEAGAGTTVHVRVPCVEEKEQGHGEDNGD